MSWRAIQDSVGVSLTLAELDDRSERIWWRLLAHSDPWGRLDARPGKVRALCFPLLPHITDHDLGTALRALQNLGRVVVWEKAGQQVIQLVDFEKHQPREAYRKRPGRSDYPDPPADLEPSDDVLDTLYPTSYPQFPEPFRKPSGHLPEETETETETERRPDGDESVVDKNHQQQHTREAAAAAAGSSDEDTRPGELSAGGWTRRQIDAARTDLDRAIAWLRHAKADPSSTKPGALAWTKFKTGNEWPSDDRAPGATGSRSTTKQQPHSCPHCGNRYATPTRLAEHLDVMHDIRQPDTEAA